MAVKFQGKYLNGFVKPEEFDYVSREVELCHDILHQKSGAGSDFLGWLNLPFDYDKEEFERIKKAAEKIRNDSEVLVVIGIGGSYLGARAAIEFLGSPFYNNLDSNKLKVYFVGNNISGAYLNQVLALCKDKEVSVNVISKSGTTTESAIAFRVFKEFMEEKYGKEGAKERIYATTDKARGTLKNLSTAEGYETFVIPDDVGGRFSVLTAVGLLPIAAAGFDIDKLMLGAQQACTDFAQPGNDCYKYAAARNILYRKGKVTEIMACYEPNWQMMNEWYKQLYGESEGKDQKGIFPASVIFSTDLHSMGQFIQDGNRNLFETVVAFNKPCDDYYVKADENNFDGLNFLADQPMSEINKKAMQGTILAHVSGGVPNILLEADAMDEENLGYIIYFFEKACAISGYMLGVNPFNQPGVEDYKVNMFALLGKPGYEEHREELLKKLGE